MEGLWELDQAVFRAIHLGWHRDWLDPLFWVISTTGLGHVQAPPLLFLVRWKNAWARATEDTPGKPSTFRILRYVRWRDFYPWAAPLLIAFLLSGVVNLIMKELLPRDRPSNLPWAAAQEAVQFRSFPSGHTITSFALAVMFVLLTRGKNPWGYMALAWACLVGLSRIYRGVHWPSDVLAAALLGSLSAVAVFFFMVWKKPAAEAVTA